MNAVACWSTSRIKYIADTNQSVLGESTDPEFEFGYVDIGSVSQGSIDLPEQLTNFMEAPSRARRLADPGDIIISTVRTYLRAVSLVPESKCPLVFSTGFAVLHPHPKVIEPRFLAYCLQSDPFINEVVANSQGVSYPAISPDRLTALRVPTPPIRLQEALASYLDKETSKIDAFIEKQRQLIVALRNRRVRTVLSAVTSGVRRDRKSTESRIHWSPDIPRDWKTKPLKHVFSSIQTGVWGEDPDGGEDDVLCVRVADFDRPRLRVGDSVETTRKVPVTDRRTKKLQQNDLLIEKSGGTGINPVGFVALYDREDEAVCANFIVRLRTNEDQDSHFWMYALHASYASGLTWNYVKQTTGIQNLDLGAFLSERFPVPPLEEQREIAEYLDRETARIDTLIAKSQRMSELSKERRSALITAAVSGQIDVATLKSREEAA